MKQFNKTFLPDSIQYKGNEYRVNIEKTHLHRGYITHQKDCIIVNVLSKNLKGVTDLHGNLYKPTVWIFEKVYPNSVFNTSKINSRIEEISN